MLVTRLLGRHAAVRGTRRRRPRRDSANPRGHLRGRDDEGRRGQAALDARRGARSGGADAGAGGTPHAPVEPKLA